jgi:hypothetical protein
VIAGSLGLGSTLGLRTREIAMRSSRLWFATTLVLALLATNAASRAAEVPPWPVKDRFLGEDGRKSKDASGIACATGNGFPRACLAIDDNLQAAQFMTLHDGELRAGDPLPLIDNKHGNRLLELDGESVAYADGAFYVMGSHGAPRRAPKNPNAEQQDLFDARIAAASQIIRIRLRRNAGQVLTPNDVEEIRATPKLRNIIADHRVLKRFLDRRLENNGLTIEGVAVVGGRLFAGFRAPTLDDGRAPVLSVELDALFGDAPSEAVLSLLPVGDGRGIRDLAPFDGGLLVLAGPSGDEAGRYSIYWWNGANESLRYLADITEATGATARRKPEAILPLDRDASGLRILILSDGEEEGAPLAITIPLP